MCAAVAMTKYTKQEWSWMLYDAASSAFSLIISTTVPLYFSLIANMQGNVEAAEVSATWGAMTSASLLLLALLSPMLGTLADYQGMKKRMFAFSLALAIAGLSLINFTLNIFAFICLFLLTRLCYSACNVFYDSMLTDVTEKSRMDMVSANGFAIGYVASCIPFVASISILLLRPFGIEPLLGFRISFFITAAWWAALSLPLLKNLKHRYYVQIDREAGAVRQSFRRLAETVRKIRKNKTMRCFIIAYFCYIDGVYTIISMATIYGSEVGISSTNMIVALLVTQLVAFPCVILAGKLAKKITPIRLIKAFIICYAGICVLGFLLRSAWQFWVLAISVGAVQGGIQTLSRSYFAKLIPKEESNEYFGFYDIFGKFADFVGPLFITLSAAITGESRYGILMLILLFAAGYALLSKIKESGQETGEA
ncbi:MAG: MFS transporter [Eubacteriaceae bacterium]|jgi:UMF1 family MFS transporter|nr:MFS transporter [Eubacteriaceae bacterium]